MKLSEVHDRLAFDKHNLEDALVEQVQLVEQVGDAWTAAISARDGAKLHAKDAETAAARLVRERAHNEGKKITEKAVAEAVEENAEVLASRNRLVELANLARAWEHKMDAVKARGMALHKIADIQIARGAAIVGQTQGRHDTQPLVAARTAHEQETVDQARKKRRSRRSSH